MNSVRIALAPLACSTLVLLSPTFAEAQNLIKNPTAHPAYSAELEPHLLLDIVGEDHFGIGGRATFEIVDPGFVSSINNTVALGVGLDWLDGDDYDFHGAHYDHSYISLPFVMQWNFWFTPHWSAFGEPGISINLDDHGPNDDDDINLDLAFFVGGRYNFNDNVALTLRLGVPSASFGVSFFL